MLADMPEMDTMDKDMRFDPKIAYDTILEKLKEDFEQKWSSTTPSPSTNLDDYDVLAVLGEGAFGKVKFVRLKGTDKYCAAKQLLKEQVVQQKQVKHVFSEKKVLQSITFPFLISLEFSSKDNDYLYMGLTFCGGGELFTYLRKMRKLNETTTRFYAAQVFLAFEYLHYNKVLYRDLKPENILIGSKGFIRVADLGMAKRVDGRTYTLCGTPEYFAPEIIQTKPYGVSVDWWTFGVLMYELLCGHTPFVTNNSMELYEKIVHVSYKMPSSFSPKLRDLIENILQADVTRRFGCMANGNKDIKYHDWFRGVDWYGYLNQEIPPPFVPKLANLEDLSNFEKIVEKRQKTKSKVNKFADVFAEF